MKLPRGPCKLRPLTDYSLWGLLELFTKSVARLADRQTVTLILQWCNPETGTAGCHPPARAPATLCNHAKGMRAGYRYGGGTSHQRTALMCLQEVSAAEEAPQGRETGEPREEESNQRAMRGVVEQGQVEERWLKEKKV